MKIVRYNKKYNKELLHMFEGIQEYERKIFSERELGHKLSKKWLKSYSPKKNKEIMYIGKEDNDIVGFVWIYFDTDELNRKEYKYLYISDLFVKDEYRGKGYGKELIKYAEIIARKKKVRGSFISVLYNNTNAYELYKKVGYENNEATLFKKF